MVVVVEEQAEAAPVTEKHLAAVELSKAGQDGQVNVHEWM